MSTQEELRSLVRGVRWSPSEWERICARAKRVGIRPSSYIRAAALRQNPKAVRSPRTARTRFSEPRSVERSIRFHTTEWERVVRLAESVGFRPDRFVREVAVGYSFTAHVNSEAIRQLARLGNLLNQLAFIAHQTREVDHAGRLEELLGKIDRLLDELL